MRLSNEALIHLGMMLGEYKRNHPEVHISYLAEVERFIKFALQKYETKNESSN